MEAVLSQYLAVPGQTKLGATTLCPLSQARVRVQDRCQLTCSERVPASPGHCFQVGVCRVENDAVG